MDEINKLRQMYIDRYIALYEEDDYKKGNRIEKTFCDMQQVLCFAVCTKSFFLWLKKLCGMCINITCYSHYIA